MPDRRPLSLLLVAPALAVVLALFVYPLGYSLVSAFTARDGEPTLDNFVKTFDLYTTDIVFTLVIVAVSTALTGLFAAAIGGYLVLGAHPAAVTLLKWLYRWPLFIPFIVAAQCMRTFLAKNGMLNNTLDTLGLVDVTSLSGLLDWRGIIVTFVWKETPFVALLVSGAMAALDRASIEAARNLGAGSMRILVEILLPQVASVMTVGLVLAFVTMLSVLSVPIMISGGSPTMITVDMAFRVNAYSDYGVANALGRGKDEVAANLFAGSRAGLVERLARLDHLDLLKSILDQDCDLKPLESLVCHVPISSDEWSASVSDLSFVHVTPAPILSRLEGLDDRMLSFVEMLPCVLMQRGIAAADVTAGEAQAQMHPARADSQALLAAFGARRYIANHFQMRVSHVVPFSYSRRSMVESAFRLSPFSGSEARSCRARARQRGVHVPSRHRRRGGAPRPSRPRPMRLRGPAHRAASRTGGRDFPRRRPRRER